jgi:putative salt-induced outer membrane protein YdiY
MRSGAALFAASCLAAPALADQVTVKGTTLEGTVLAVGAKTVQMKTVYGDGTLTLKTADVTEIRSDGVFRVYHGESLTEGSTLLVSAETLEVNGTSVPLASLHAVQNTTPEGELSLMDRIALAYPFWSGNFDLAFNYTDSTVNSLSLATGLSLRRVKAPTRFLITASYWRSTSEDELGNNEGNVLANELRGLTRFEYDFAPRWFAYGSLEGEHDAVERIAFRGIPKAGIGYKVWEVPETSYVSVDAGAAWVYERFFGGERTDYFSLAVGAEASHKFANGWIWFARLDYLPSVEDWVDDFLLRGETSLVFPLTEHFALKTSLEDLYDATPAEGAESNSLQTLVGVSVLF